ncbi:chemotaxis protein CheA [Caldicellulosiruptor acetigenus]|uniref:chemotaxis protein CheA n=1 Tax=Caldicellulosiruptor acetigenus TaxID=301953 RepID=UPI00040292F1|nr:chemotaxis protein CheA [Caldicellulosiruptor acetigenus]WAM36725.1 chemotaxis protein CheA [Caldicellulosiruptor acetigenus]
MRVMVKEDELEILEDFLSESNEYLNNIEAEILALEERKDDEELVNSLFRKYHSMKGLSGFFEGMGEFTLLCQIIEDVLAKIRNKTIKVSSDVIDFLLKGSDIIKRVVFKIGDERKAEKGYIEVEEEFDLDLFAKEKEELINREILKAQSVSEGREREIEFVEEESFTNEEQGLQDASSNQLDRKDTIEQVIASTTSALSAELNEVKISYEKIDEMLGLVGEIITTKSTFYYLVKELEKYDMDLSKRFSELFRSIQRTSEILQDHIMKIRMIPFEMVVKRFNRLIRETAKKTRRKVKFSYTCGDVVIDKGIAEKLSEPLMHIIRNCIDHGIEDASERKKLGKPEHGKVELISYYKGQNIVIEISDDGRGMDIGKIIRKAVEKGIISEEQAGSLTADEAIKLIFEPGFSTKDVADEISGRGVGMDVVKNIVESLKGKVEVITEEGKGSKFILEIPTTAAVSQGIVVVYNSQKFIIPFEYVEETVKINVKNVYGCVDKLLIDVRDEPIPLYPISYVLYQEDLCNEDVIKRFVKDGELSVVILNVKGVKIAVCVDKLMQNEEFVLKPLPKALEKNKLLLGTTIDYEGNVILVLNPEYFRL